MKTKRKSLKLVCSIVISFVGLLGIFALTMFLIATYIHDGSELPAEENGISLRNWMNAIEDDVLLVDVAIPGSHDAGCAEMMWAYQTQNKSIREQLEMGVRYFDIRIADDDGELRVFHGGNIGKPFMPMLEDIISFMNDNPSEILLLDFQHFYTSKKIADSTVRTYETLEEKLGAYFIRNDSGDSDLDYVNALTLGEARGKCVVFWGRHYTDKVPDADWMFTRDDDEGNHPEASIHSYYIAEYNKKSSAKYVEECLDAYWEMDAKGQGGIFVLQGQLTDGLLIFGPAFRELTHRKRMDDYVLNMPDDKVARVNVIMRDYCTPRKSGLTIALNVKKNIVKAGYADILSSWASL